jgi:hypothetical protein
MHGPTHGRTIQIGPYERQLARARERQADPAWKADYNASRPKVERKISHLTRRRHGRPRARVRGKPKEVSADFALLAAAVNLARLAVLKLTAHHGSGRASWYRRDGCDAGRGWRSAGRDQAARPGARRA